MRTLRPVCAAAEKTVFLVVIGIIAVLAGLLLGGVTLARSSARTTECQNNQNQTMKIIALSMNANKDFLVSGDDFSDAPGNDAAWTRFLYGEGTDNSGSMKGKTAYIADMAVLRCPTFKYSDNNQALGALDSTKREAALKEAFGLVYRDSAETGATFAGFDFRGSKFKKFGTGSSAYPVSPNQLLLGGCASKSAPYDTAGALLYKGSWENKLVKAHSDKCNVFFLDGHVENLNLAELEQKYLPSASSNETVKFPSGDSNWIDPDK